MQTYVFISTTNLGPRVACQAVRGLKGVVRADACLEALLLSP